jgi:hypothetical protein
MASHRELPTSRGRIPGSYKLNFAVLLSAVVIASEPARANAFCLAPVAIADRWNDTIAIPGYTGETRKTPDWRNDGIWEREAFTDVNDDGLYDAGEPYVDANANGSYDAFARHTSPLTTVIYTHASDEDLREGVRGLRC